MKVFVTGASGFVGSAVVDELIKNGHSVIGLARSEESAQKVKDAGAEVLSGGLEDLDVLKKGAQSADAVIHTAFIHDFSNYAKSAEVDQVAIDTLGAALEGTNKPFLVTGGLLGVKSAKGGLLDEDDAAPAVPRPSEAAGLAWADKGVKVGIVRLPPSVHDKNDHGFVPMIINTAKEKGVSAYVGDGQNHWPAVHRLDAALLYRLAIEKGEAGTRYNAIGDQGVTLKEIAELIGKELNIPVKSVTPEEAANHFTWMARFITMDSAAASPKTEALLGWKPTNIGLLEDMKANYLSK